MIPSIKKILIVCFITCVSGFAQDVNYETLNDFFNALNTHDKFMGTMTITKNGHEVFSKAIGFADSETQVELANNSKFRIGSITKAFTAVIIFQLIDEDQLTLQTPLSKFFPEVPNASKITIANLLNHSSGLYNITSSKDFGEWMYKPSSQEDMISRIAEFEVDFQPSEKTEYSNTNYILLGYIAEALDEKSYASILKTRIADKIGLTSTYYGGSIVTNNNESYSYAKGATVWQKQNETDMSNPGGAGAIVSTAKDLTTFFNALFDNKLMSETSFTSMKQTNDKETCHGIFYANMNGNDIYASEGGIDGFQSMLAHVPATKITVALTSNALDFSKMRIMLSAIAVSHGQAIMQPKFTKIELTEADVKQYEGEYVCDQVPYKLIFKAEGNILMGAPEQSNLKELTPTKQHQFTLEAMSLVIDFYPETGIARFTQGNNETLLFKKL